MTNEVLVNASRDYQWRGSGDKHTNYAGALGLPNPFQAANWPNFSNFGLTSPTSTGTYPYGTAGLFWLVTQFRADRGQRDQDSSASTNSSSGFHIRDEWIGKSANSTAGSFDAGTLATSLYDPASTAASPQALPLTGFGLANFELGVLNYNAVFQRRWYNFRRQEFDPYFQDNWKVSRRLTLNLGLRYEMRSPLYDKDGTLLSFDFAKHALVTGTSVDNFVKLGETTPAILSALTSVRRQPDQLSGCRRSAASWFIATGRSSARGWASRTGRSMARRLSCCAAATAFRTIRRSCRIGSDRSRVRSRWERVSRTA